MLTWYYDTLRSPSYEISNALKMIDDFGFKTLSTKNYHIDESSIKIEMAGVNASEIDVSVDGKFLKISAKSKHGKEHSYSYKLNSSVDESSITATIQDGLLEISLPKKKDSQPRKIEVL